MNKNKLITLFTIILCLATVFTGIQIYLGLPEKSPPSTANSLDGEEYIWVATMTGHKMFQDNDVAAFEQFGRDKHVTATIMGPKEYDIPGQIEALEEAIQRKPAGILVLGMEQSLTDTINKAIRQGIPVITVDSDVSTSDRIAYVGSDWYKIGVTQAEAMVKLIGGKGKIAIMGIGGADTTDAAFKGYRSVIDNYPDITIVGEYDDMANYDEAERITKMIVDTHPDIAGLSGFNTNSAVGIANGLKKSAASQDIKVTAMDIEPENLALVADGTVDVIIGQKRAVFTYYAATLLYDINHSSLKINNLADGVTSIIPDSISTGVITVTKENLQSYFPDM
jgi:ABC-type sugar transport system, periplasmic component